MGTRGRESYGSLAKARVFVPLFVRLRFFRIFSVSFLDRVPLAMAPPWRRYFYACPFSATHLTNKKKESLLKPSSGLLQHPYPLSQSFGKNILSVE
jgi:hypothetical protein